MIEVLLYYNMKSRLNSSSALAIIIKNNTNVQNKMPEANAKVITTKDRQNLDRHRKRMNNGGERWPHT
jgi:hypothetical protein